MARLESVASGIGTFAWHKGIFKTMSLLRWFAAEEGESGRRLNKHCRAGTLFSFAKRTEDVWGSVNERFRFEEPLEY